MDLATISLLACLAQAVLVKGQGINVNPVPGLSTDTDLDDRWWFWVIIGIIAAFFVVAVAFVIRGFRMYKRYKAIVLQEAKLASELSPADVEMALQRAGNEEQIPIIRAWADSQGTFAAEVARRTGASVTKPLERQHSALF